MNPLFDSHPSMNQRKGRRPLRLLCFWIVLVIILAGCALPEAPGDLSWDTHVTVPFGIRTYGLLELVDSTEAIDAAGSGIGMDEDSLLYYAAFTELKIPLYDSLTIEPIIDTLFKPAWLADTTSFYEVANRRHRLIQGTIETGTVTVSARNVSDVSDTVRVTFPNLLNPLGEWLVIKRFVAAQSQSDTTWNLAGYRVYLVEDIPQQVEIRLHASAGSEIQAIVNTSRFLFRYYTGILDEQELESFTSGRSVELPPEGWESVHPTEVEALIHVEHGVNGLLANIATDIATYLNGSTLASANLNASGINLGRDTSAVVPDLLPLLQIYPDSISANGHIIASGRVQNVQRGDTIRLKLEMRAPLRFTMDQLHAPDSVIKVENNDAKDIQSGTLKIRVWNRLPVSGHAYLVMDRDRNAVLPESGADVDTLFKVNIPAPDIGGGRAVSTVYFETVVELDDHLLEYFRVPPDSNGVRSDTAKVPPFFVRTDLTLPGTNGDTLVAHAGDYIKIQPFVDIAYRLNTGDEE